MHAASRHRTPSLTFLAKDEEVSCLVRHLEDHPSKFKPHLAKINFSYLTGDAGLDNNEKSISKRSANGSANR